MGSSAAGIDAKLGYATHDSPLEAPAYQRLVGVNEELNMALAELEKQLAPVLKAPAAMAEVKADVAPASPIESLVIDLNTKLGWLRSIIGRLDL